MSNDPKRTPLDDAKLRLSLAKYWNGLLEDWAGIECKEWKEEEKKAEEKIEYCELEEKYNEEEHGPIDQLEI